MTEFEEERFRELAARVMAGVCSEGERQQVEVGLLGGGRAAEVFAEEARAAVVIEEFFVGERKRGGVIAELGEVRGRRRSGWWGEVAAVLVGLLGILGLGWSGREAVTVAGVERRVIEAEAEPVVTGGGGGVKVAESETEDVTDEGEEMRRLLSRFFLPEVELEDVPLADALGVLGDALEAYNLNGVESLKSLVLGAGRDLEGRRVTLKTRGVPLLTVLRSFAAQVGAEVVVDPPAVALVAVGSGVDQGMLTKLYAGAGELFEGDEDARTDLLVAWGAADPGGTSSVMPDGNLLLRNPVAKMAAAEVMLEELRRREEEPLTLEIIRVVVDGDVADGLEERVESREGAERLIGELEVVGRVGERKVGVAEWPDQAPLVVESNEEVEAEGAGEEDAGEAVALLAELGGRTLVPMRVGNGFAVGMDSASVGGDAGSFVLDAGSLLVLSAGEGLGDGQRAVFFVGVSEGGAVVEPVSEEVEP